ncbi:VRR-NUC domain-containing protein [Aspergillus luchuensis]|uniref:VRR-NUC domain-containing protein n=1 Tax=Aspergillus kawachii TaxID=1069201 RepID=A0A146EY13_ASPKA|nr:VRR-NUC domain-containing protein [Aspergillus luchuensis]
MRDWNGCSDEGNVIKTLIVVVILLPRLASPQSGD